MADSRFQNLTGRLPTFWWITIACAAGLVIGVVPSIPTLGLIAIGLAFFATCWRPELGVAAIVLIVPLQRTLVEHVSAWGSSSNRLVVLAILTGWLTGALLRDDTIEFDFVSIALAVHIAVLVLTFVVTTNAGKTAGEVYRWAVTLPAYLMTYNVIRSRQNRNLVVGTVAVTVAVMATVAIWQVTEGLGPATFELRGFQRAFGTFGQPNQLAGFLGMTLPLLFAMSFGELFQGRNLRDWLRDGWQIALALTAMGGVLALVLSQSRGGLLGLAIGFALMGWLFGGWARKLGLILAAAIAVLLLATPIGWGAWIAVDQALRGQRNVLVTPDNWAVEERLAHWGAAVQMAKAHPVLGVGAGNFDEVFRRYTPEWRFRIPRGHAHNAYLNELAEAGVIGLTTYLILIGGVLLTSWRACRRAISPHAQRCAIGVMGVSTAIAAHNTVDFLHGLGFGLIMAVVWGMGSAIANHPESHGASA